MRSRLTLALIALIILFSFLLVGCQSGVAPEEYDKMAAQLQTERSKTAEVQGQVNKLQAEKEALAAELKAAQAKIAELQGQVGGLKDKYELVGATKAETAEKIVRYYHETHVYSTYDLFVCSDMSTEVWNMLKAQGINSVIAIGNKDSAITDILQSDHAWVLAEVAPGDKLALETTGGYTVPRSQNPLYYRGWYFDSPAKLKSNNELVREYNVRVGIHNQIVAEAQKVAEEHNKATNQTTADIKKAVYDELVKLIEAQEAEMNKIKSELNKLASVLS